MSLHQGGGVGLKSQEGDKTQCFVFKECSAWFSQYIKLKEQPC